MNKTVILLLSIGTSALVSSCAHEDPAPQAVRTEATGASVSIHSTSHGTPQVEIKVQGGSSVQSQTPTETPQTPPDKLPAPQGNAADTKDFL